MIAMWILEGTPQVARQLKKLEKTHKREVTAILDNLDTYVVSLNQEVKPMQLVKHSFVHNERKGVHAIDQSPIGRGGKALRLYVYPHCKSQTLHLIRIGGKECQSEDIQRCYDYVRSLEGLERAG